MSRSRRVTARAAAVVAATSAALGCFATTSEVRLLRTQLPALPPDCPVRLVASATPPDPVEDLVVLSLAYAPGGRDAALNMLRDRACYYGGDTLYDVVEQPRSNASTLFTAKIARRAPPPVAARTSPGPAGDGVGPAASVPSPVGSVRR